MKSFIYIVAAAVLLASPVKAFVSQSASDAKSFNNYVGSGSSGTSVTKGNRSSSSNVRRIRLDKKQIQKSAANNVEPENYSYNLDKDNKFSLVLNNGDYITFTGQEPQNARWEFEAGEELGSVDEQHNEDGMLLKLKAQTKGVSRVSLQLVFRQNRVVRVLKSKRIMVTVRP